eukprot:m.48806 g.48806  ORF g.48806 m.48806 type:complete len:1415 (+) comp33927_c0_seq11:615-4859(+)
MKAKLKQKVRVREIHCVDQASTDSAASVGADNDNDDVDRRRYSLFPSAVYSAIPKLINLLDDPCVGQSNCMTVGESAQRVVWDCLVEEPALFFRPFQEKGIRIKEQGIILQTLRRLLLFFPSLPSAASQFIYNHMIGMIMYYTNDAKGKHKEGAQEIILDILSLLWQVVPSVRGLNLKQLKDRLKKEHCDMTVVVNSKPNIAKSLSISFPSKSGWPVVEHFPIKENDLTFDAVLTKAAELFKFQRRDYYLEDARNGCVIVPGHYVGDHYFHGRKEVKKGSHHLRLVPYGSQKAGKQIADQRQRIALMHTVGELCRVLHSDALLKNIANAEASTIPKGMTTEDFLLQHLEILHGDLSRQPSFPRRALESNFELYKGVSGKELAGADLLHKQVWVSFVARLFHHMPPSFSWGSEAALFLHVINGAMLLHCEDRSMLRLCMATLLGAVRKYGNLFPAQGYKHIIPTLLRTYSSHSSYDYVLKGLEYFLKECYCLHENRFLLELLSAAAPLVVTQRVPYFSHKRDQQAVSKFLPVHLFSILKSLEKSNIEDVLCLEHLAWQKQEECISQPTSLGETKANFCVLDSVKLIVSIVVCGPDKLRGSQMLYLLDCLMPFLLNCLDRRLTELAYSMQILIKGCHILKDNYPYQNVFSVPSAGSSFIRFNKSPFSTPHSSEFFARPQNQPTDEKTSQLHLSKTHRSQSLDVNKLTSTDWRRPQKFRSSLLDETDFSGHLSDHVDETMVKRRDAERQRELMNRREFRESRDSLLSLTAEFICTGLRNHIRSRNNDLSRCDSEDPILLGSACHLNLALVANSLLKLAPFDAETMACEGLRRYMLEFLPSTADVIHIAGFTDPGYQGAMYRIITRIHKIFQRLDFATPLDWNSLSLLLKGPYLVLQRQRALARMEPFRELVETVLRIVNRRKSNLAPTTPAEALSATAVAVGAPKSLSNHFSSQEPPPFFCESVVRLVTMTMVALKDEYSLEKVCGNPATFRTADSNPTRILRTLLLPLCIRLGCGRADWPKASPKDVRYTVACLLQSLLSGSAFTAGGKTVRSQVTTRMNRASQFFTSLRRHEASSQSFTSERSSTKLTDKTAIVVFHGLKIVTVCFEKQLMFQWNSIASAVKRYSKISYNTIDQEAVAFWDFLDFLATEKGPLFVLLKIFIGEKTRNFVSDESKKLLKDYAKKLDLARAILRKLNPSYTEARCKAELLQRLAHKLAEINELKPPSWDADTPDVVSLAALQKPPTKRRHQSLFQQSQTTAKQAPSGINEESTDDELEEKAPVGGRRRAVLPQVSERERDSNSGDGDGESGVSANGVDPSVKVVHADVHRHLYKGRRRSVSRQPSLPAILDESRVTESSEDKRGNGIAGRREGFLRKQKSFDVTSPVESPNRSFENNGQALRISRLILSSDYEESIV